MNLPRSRLNAASIAREVLVIGCIPCVAQLGDKGDKGDKVDKGDSTEKSNICKNWDAPRVINILIAY
jgi:hypothetical protein